MLKFYTVKGGGRLTSCVGPSLWLLEETGNPYQTIELDVDKSEHKAEWFLKLNPNGKIPCLEDGNYLLWESVAINYYVAGKYKPELLGSNVQERGLIDQWMMWSLSEFQPGISSIFINAMKPPEQRDSNYMQICKNKILRQTVMIDKYLRNKKFFANDKLSLADIQIASFMNFHSVFHSDFTLYPSFRKWYQNMMIRPALSRLEQKKLLIVSHHS